MSKKNDWMVASRNNPCPICARAGWCSISANGDVALCHHEADGAFMQKVSKSGAPCFFHRLKPGEERPKPNPRPSKPAPEPAGIDTRDRIYRGFSRLFPLSDRHRQGLRGRGLSDVQIDALGYLTLPTGSRRVQAAELAKQFGKADVLATPGFYEADGEMRIYAPPGILIPCRDLAGRIQAFQVRKDDASKPDAREKSGKYAWLSSAKCEGGVGPGCPAHVSPDFDRSRKTARITEGALKGDVAARLSGVSTIAVAGVSNWKPAIPFLKQARIETVRIAYDADARSKSQVANALDSLSRGLQAEGFRVELELWDESDGKGIDDLLRAGKAPTVVAGEQARDELAAIVASAAKVKLTKTPRGRPGQGLDTPEILSRRIQAMIESAGFEGLYRDRSLLAALAALQHDNPAEFSAVRAELKKNRRFSAKDLEGALKPHAPRPDSPQAGDDSSYWAAGGKIYLQEQTKNGPRTVQVCNFEARIVEEIAIDDGEEAGDVDAINFRIEGTANGRKFGFEIPAAEFGAMDWVLSHIGAGAIISAGRGMKDHARAAIQFLSGGVARSVVYSHSGWRKLDSLGWCYLSGSGAISGDGLHREIVVNLGEGTGQYYRLPEPPSGERLRQAIRAKLGLSRFGSDLRRSSKAMAAVCNALPARAVLGTLRFSASFRGPTGTFKSEAAALVSQHFGPALKADNLLGWNGTPLSIMQTSHVLKDAVLALDDFVPTGSSLDVSQKHREADQVLRSQGNGQGRSRCNVDGTLARQRRPRATILSTGEDRFKERSLNARAFSVAFAPRPQGTSKQLGTVDAAILTEAQRDASSGLYAEATSAFVRWLASRLDEVRESLPGMVESLRPVASIQGSHARTPVIVAELMAGFDVFLDFAVDVGAISPEEREVHREKVWDGLIEGAMEARDENQEEGSPAETYLNLIRSALMSTAVHLLDKDSGDMPGGRDGDQSGASRFAELCGWHQELKYIDGHQRPVWQPPPNSRLIGWVDTDFVYLDPDGAYTVAMDLARKQNIAMISKSEMHLHLHNSGFIGKQDARSGGSEASRRRFTSRTTIGKQQTYVLVLKRSAVFG